MAPNLITKHKGHNDEGIHAHEKWAKYLFMSSNKLPPEDYVHAHASYKSIASLANHLATAHKDEDEVDLPVINEEHEHEKFQMKDPSSNFANALYVNPLAMDMGLFDSAEVVFFVIEGSFKCNAILSTIIATDVPAAVFSVPSVFGWMNLPELKTAVQGILKDKPIVIVPDADWAKNPAVNAAANMCRMTLIRYGADPSKVIIAAPPVIEHDDGTVTIPEAWNPYKVKENEEHTAYEIIQTMEEMKGVDDFLGFGQGNLGDLQVNGYELPDEAAIRLFFMEFFASSTARTYPKASTLANCVNALLALSSFSACRLDNKENPRDYIQVSAKTLGNVLGMDHRVIMDTLRLLQASGAIEVEGEYADQKGEFGSSYDRSEDFPTVTVARGWRSTKVYTKTLREFFPFLV